MTFFYSFILSILIFHPLSSFAKTQIVELSQKVEFNSGDIIILKNTSYSVKIGSNPGTDCAGPGFNCGSGYQPPTPSFSIDCGKQLKCPYVLMNYNKTATSGSLTIEDEKSCENKFKIISDE